MRVTTKPCYNKLFEIKANPYGYQHIGRNKTVGLIFFNPSLRTRLSSIKAAYNLGAQAWVLNAGDRLLDPGNGRRRGDERRHAGTHQGRHCGDEPVL